MTPAPKPRAKHGGDLEQEPISQIASPSGNQSLDLLVLERALSKLAEADARQARIIELWFFAGMTMEEIAEILEISDRTVRRDWRHARAWLNSEMASSETM
ncbi:MAG: sigma-70 family RNA polymerase sigma factor [Candidatus Eisenbacteria bacterium]